MDSYYTITFELNHTQSQVFTVRAIDSSAAMLAARINLAIDRHNYFEHYDEESDVYSRIESINIAAFTIKKG